LPLRAAELDVIHGRFAHHANQDAALVIFGGL
jgi:hypothetical protein